MATELVIHCVGLEGLTITVSGADHSIPIITDVLRVTTLLGSVEYTIPQLPVTYNTADLNGNLTIPDGSGKTLYRWRSHAIAQPPSAEHQQPRSEPTYNHERQKHPPCISAPPSYRTAGTPPNLRSSGALNELNNSQIASSDADAMAENPDGVLPLSFLIQGLLTLLRTWSTTFREWTQSDLSRVQSVAIQQYQGPFSLVLSSTEIGENI